MLLLTQQGYAERRVRFREVSGAISREYLARGSVTVTSDSTLDLELRDMSITSRVPWRPVAWLVDDGVEIRHPDPEDGSTIVETYRRKQ